jgi:hypothetical protein
VKQDRNSQTIQEMLALASQEIIHPQLSNPTIIIDTREAIQDSRSNAQFSLVNTDTITDLMRLSDLSIIFQDSKIIYHMYH